MHSESSTTTVCGLPLILKIRDALIMETGANGVLLSNVYALLINRWTLGSLSSSNEAAANFEISYGSRTSFMSKLLLDLLDRPK